MTDETQEAEELLQQAKQQKRHKTEPTRDDGDDTPSLEAAIAKAYEKIDANEIPETLTLRDEHLAALFAGLDETDQLQTIGAEAAKALDRDVDSDLGTRATVLKLLVRIGIQEAQPEVIDAAKAGRKQHLEKQADEF